MELKMLSQILTVIIPTYNSEQYIATLLDSLSKQTYINFNLIIVDDCSADNTIGIVENYKSYLPQLNLYVLDENHGPSYCRNFGLSKVVTPYVTFADSDDWIDVNTYEECLAFMNMNVDVINYGIIYENNENGESDKKYLYTEEMVLTGRESLRIYGHTNDKQVKIAPIVNNKIYKTEFLKNNSIQFNEKIRYQEDDIFTFEVLLNANNVAFVTKCFYHYIQRQQSLIHQVSEISVTHFVLAYYDLMCYLKSRNIYLLYREEYISKFMGSLKAVIKRVKCYSSNKTKESELLMLLSKMLNGYFDSEKSIKSIDIDAI